MKGWYMHDSIIGIICQDIRGRNGSVVSGRIKNTIHEKGIFHLTGNTDDAVKFLCLLYPNQ
jgi:hypothetical protein